MSNYTQTTFFTPKDTLPATDPNKTIFGAAYDVEFGNIATAIATKPDATTVASFLNVNVTSNGLPANGLYLPSANQLGFATNTTLRATLATGLFMAGATGGDQGAGTINATGLFVNGVAVVGGGASSSSGTFTANYTGFTGTPTGTGRFSQVGNSVTISLPVATGTSNAVSFGVTGIPVGLRPANDCYCALPAYSLMDNGVILTVPLVVYVSSIGGLVQFKKDSSGINSWTGSGTKGVSVGPIIFTYQTT